MDQEIIKKMVGQKIDSICLSPDKKHIVFNFKNGLSIHGSVYGDCCSNSWIEHLEMPENIEGSTLLGVQDSDSIKQNHPEHDEENGGDSIEVYNTSFKTDRGEIILEYRNSSNGYYGGSLELQEKV